MKKLTYKIENREFAGDSKLIRILLLTGSPGVGKTTVLLKTVEALKAKGYSLGGMVSREVRSCGTRVGFEILDLADNKTGWLAHVNQKTGPRIGRYHVNLEDLKNVGVKAIMEAVEKADVIVIDEIGPMELCSEDFKDAVRRAVKSEKLMICTVHRKTKDKLVEEVKTRMDSELFTVTYKNRSFLHSIITNKALSFLSKQ
ncbi:NTPase [Candidatus Bathyarchaeota archaeon]|nr:MAG: NTPase [Candidatus Bathyarchaeota archaeon]